MAMLHAVSANGVKHEGLVIHADTGMGVFRNENEEGRHIYEGEYLRNKAHGLGVWMWEDNSTESGGWADGEPAGHRVVRSADGTVEYGECNNGWVQLVEEILEEDGSRERTFETRQPHFSQEPFDSTNEVHERTLRLALEAEVACTPAPPHARTRARTHARTHAPPTPGLATRRAPSARFGAFAGGGNGRHEASPGGPIIPGLGWPHSLCHRRTWLAHT
jgi:hypothetical protein